MPGRRRSNGRSIVRFRPTDRNRSVIVNLALGSEYTERSRARWGAGGALYPQPALAGLNSLSRFGFVGLTVPRGVENNVPCGGNL